MRLRRYLDTSRKQGGAALLVAQSKLDSLAFTLALELPEGFSFEQVEAAVIAEVKAWGSLSIPAWNSDEEKAIAEQKRKAAGPSKDEYRAMSAEDRLEAINKAKLAEIEDERNRAQRLPADHGLNHDDLVSMTPDKKLATAREWAALGEAPKPEPKRNDYGRGSPNESGGSVEPRKRASTALDEGRSEVMKTKTQIPPAIEEAFVTISGIQRLLPVPMSLFLLHQNRKDDPTFPEPILTGRKKVVFPRADAERWIISRYGKLREPTPRPERAAPRTRAKS